MATVLLTRAKLLEQEEQVLVKLKESLAGQLRRLQVEELAIRSMMRTEEMAEEEEEAAAAARGGSSSSRRQQRQPDQGSTMGARAAATAAYEVAEDEVNTQPLALSLDIAYGKLWSDEYAEEVEDDGEAEEDEEEN